MRLSLVLDTANAAFDGEDLGPEVSRILIKYANAIKTVKDPDTSIDLETRLRDINGNKVGYVKWII